MSCSFNETDLWDYRDGECGPEDRKRAEEHLVRCALCRGKLERWDALSSRIFTREETRAPAFMWTRVLAGIESEAARRSAGSWWGEWRWMVNLTAATAVAISFLAGYAFLKDPVEPFLRGEEADSVSSGPVHFFQQGTSDETTAWILKSLPESGVPDTEAES
jgi:anti-sigma factor RsiW